MDDFEAFALRKAAHSIAAFGPRQMDEGILDHLKKEIEEVRKAERPKEKQREWVDIFMLGLDGLLRSLIREGYSTSRAASEAVHMIRTKQTALESREWPDWRTVAPDKAIEHVRPKPGYAELDARVSATAEKAPIGSFWQHVKSGSLYRVEGICLIEASCEPAIIYHLHLAEAGQMIRWMRPAAEFLDGRFARHEVWAIGATPPLPPRVSE